MRKIAAYLGDVLEDKKEKLLENLQANGSEPINQSINQSRRLLVCGTTNQSINREGSRCARWVWLLHSVWFIKPLRILLLFSSKLFRCFSRFGYVSDTIPMGHGEISRETVPARTGGYHFQGEPRRILLVFELLFYFNLFSSPLFSKSTKLKRIWRQSHRATTNWRAIWPAWREKQREFFFNPKKILF